MQARKIIQAVIAIVCALALIIGIIAVATSSDGQNSPQKTVSLKVIDGGGKSTSYKFKTNCIYLKDAILTDNFAEGEDREEGFWIKRVGEITAGEDEHWQIYIEGKLTAKKADKIKLENEASYSLKLISQKEK